MGNEYPKWWLEDFRANINDLIMDDGTDKNYEFGYKTSREGENGSIEVFTVPDWGNIEKFIHRVAKDSFEAGVRKFLELSGACKITSMYSLGENLYLQLGEAELKEDVTLVPESALQKLMAAYVDLTQRTN